MGIASNWGVTVADIFLSYNREDAGVAKLFADAFARDGLEVWWDQTLRSGEAYDEVTEEALRGAKAVVVLWSPRSVASRWVRAEASIADENGTLTPVKIAACDLPVMFRLTQTADLSDWRGEAGDRAWQAFLGDVRRMVGRDVARASTPPPQSSVPPEPGRGRPAVAVLPFVNRSGLAEDDMFAECVVEDISAALSFNTWMTVVAASATVAYRGGARDLPRIGRELAATYLLEGNVRRIGGTVRVAMQLVEAGTGKILWNGKFDGSADELAAFQEEMAGGATAQVGVQVQRAEMERAIRKTGEVSAWEAIVRAVACISRYTRAGYEDAIAECKRAIEIDPNFGLAYGEMAIAQASLAIYADPSDPRVQQEVMGNIRKARALDPDDPMVLVVCAGTLMISGKAQEALPFVQRAVSINPNLEFARAMHGIGLIQLGRLDEGLAELDTAERLAPDVVWSSNGATWRSVALMLAGRLESALEATEQASRIGVGDHALVQRTLCFALLGDRERARATVRQLIEIDPGIDDSTIENIVGYLHGHSGSFGHHAAILHEIWDEVESGLR